MVFSPTYLVQIVFFVNLAFHLAIDSKAKEEGVLLASGGRGVNLALVEDVGESANGLGGGAHLSLDRVLKVARQLLNFFNLLLQIASQTSEGENNILLDVLRLLRLHNGSLVVGAEQLQSIIDASRLEEVLWSGQIVGGVAELGQ